MSFGKKLFLVFLVPLFLGLILFSFLAFRYEKNDIYQWEMGKTRLLSLAISGALRNEMLHHYAHKVRELIVELRKSGRFEVLRIWRTSGEEAFLTRETTRPIENQKGRIKESQNESHPDLKEVPRLETSEFQSVIQKGKEATFIKESGNTSIVTTLAPIFNEKDCYGCHEPKDNILGVIQVSTSLSEAERFITDNLKRNLIISLSIFLAVSGLGIFLTLQTIRPLKKLRQGVSLISRGVMPVDLDIHTGDEIEELGQEIHEMSLTLQKQRARIQSLFDASQAISANLELEEVLQLIVERAYLLIEAKAGALTYRVSAEGSEPRYVFRYAGLKPGDCLVTQSPLFSGLNGAVMRLKKALRLVDYSQHPVSQPLPPGHFPVGPFLGAPIIIRGVGVGQVYVVREPGATPFIDYDEEILTSFANQAAIAIQNAENYQEAQERVEKFKTLEKIGDAMLSSLDTESILKEGFDMVMKLAKVDKGALLIKNRQNVWNVTISKEFSEEILSQLENSVAVGSRGVSILQGKVYLAEWSETSEESLRIRLSIPLRGKGGVIGVIDLFSPASNFFPGHVLEILQVAADQVAMGIENTRLYQEAQLRLEQAGVFQDFAEVAVMMSTRDELLSAAVKGARKLFPCDYGIIFLYDSSIDSLQPAATWGSEAQPPEACESCLDAVKKCLALRRGRLISVRDKSERLACAHCSRLFDGEEGSFLCAPMMALGNIIGMLRLVWRKPYAFDSDRQALLSQFAEQVALALGNLAQFEMIQKQAVTDSLTGLHNFRFFQEHVNKEIGRARRKGETLSILMIDIDNFKKFNDTYGHHVGDEVLRALGVTLPKLVREADLTARYGGEEFVVCLPDTDSEGAKSVAEKLRKTVSDLKIRGESGIDLSITISVGIATFPEHGSTPREVLKAADIALYQSKEEGRNRVTVYKNY